MRTEKRWFSGSSLGPLIRSSDLRSRPGKGLVPGFGYLCARLCHRALLRHPYRFPALGPQSVVPSCLRAHLCAHCHWRTAVWLEPVRTTGTIGKDARPWGGPCWDKVAGPPCSVVLQTVGPCQQVWLPADPRPWPSAAHASLCTCYTRAATLQTVLAGISRPV